jgi:PLP dependent protein
MPFSDLPDRLAEIRRRIDGARERGGKGQTVEIIAVTKTLGPEAVSASWTAGIRMIGENRVQEALSKMESVTVPVEWHLIGHLQRNKAKQIGRFAMLHSLDNLRLAEVVSAFGMRSGVKVRALVQVNTSGEETKGGFTIDELRLGAPRLAAMDGLEVAGVMTMAPFDADETTLRTTFAGARTARDVLRDAGHPAEELSMGMSSDFEVAVEEGATMVRLGTILFGERAR